MHLCLIYETDPEEHIGALLPYLSQGLTSGERCLYVADHATLDYLTRAMADYGIDVKGEISRGALELRTREQWSLDEDDVNHARTLLDSATERGFSGLRIGIEMTWTLGPDIQVYVLKRWESTLNAVCTPDTPIRIVCQYGRGYLEPHAVLAALHSHPLTVLGTDVCPNPYYAPPEPMDQMPDMVPSSAPVDWMIAQLQWTRAFEREREQRIEAQARLVALEDSQRRIEELYKIAETTAVELRKANAIKDEFVGLVSHELRTPITVILGNATVLLKEHAVRQ